MNVHILVPRRKPKRRNPQWLLDIAHGIRTLRIKVGEYRRLRRTVLHLRACLWCAWHAR